MSSPKGYPTQTKDGRVGAQFATVEPIDQSKYGLTVNAQTFNYVVASDTVEANTDTKTNKFRVKATAHAAIKGDIIRFTSGSLSGREIKVSSVFDANHFDLVEEMSSAIAVAVTFQILRPKAPVINSDGTLFTSSSGTLSYNLDGVATTVSEDTVTPANSNPLPVKLMGLSGPINITAGDLNVGVDQATDSVKIGDGTDLLAVNADGSINTVTSVPGIFDEDSAHVSGDKGIQVLVVRKDTAGTLADTDGDYSPLQVNAFGRLRVAPGSENSVGVANTSAIQVAGNDGAVQRALHVDASGDLQVDILSSALPTDAATETTLAILQGRVPPGLTVASNLLLVDGSGVTQPVSAASLPLPTGAATEATLSTLDGKVPANLTVTATRLLVDGSGVTQPVSGTFWQATQPISAAALPLPSGAATEAKQDTGNTSLSNIDGKVPANLTVTATRLLVDGSGVTQPVSAASLPLPTGAATEATLSTLNGKVPANLTVSSTRLLVDGSGVTQPVSGTVTANIGTTNGIALDASVTGLQVSQGSTTSGQKGGLILGAVTTAAPSYTTGQSSPLSLDTSGALRITGTVSTSGATYQSPVDFLDTPLLDASSTNIPASSSNSVQVVASLAAQVRKVQVLDTTGGFYGVYSGVVSSPTLLFIVGPGSDQTIDCSISAGTLISLRSMTTSAITSGNVAINFIG